MRPRLLATALLACGLLVLALPAGAGIERTFTFAGGDLEVVDMIGAVTVGPAAGDAFTVKVTVRGEDATDDLLGFEVVEGRDARLAVVYPLDEHDDYVYPPLGRGRTTMHFRDGREGSSWLRKIFDHGDRVQVRGGGGGLEAWADLEIGVPAGGRLRVRLGVGAVEVADVDGDLELDTHSGSVTVRDVTGDVLADTGSGPVDVRGVAGRVHADTGSGGVTVRDVKGPRVFVDTGSGSVVVQDVACDELEVDTGSGGVEARGIAADRAGIDTGSGSVVLALDRMGTGRFVVDTGSGGIELALPADASARIEADTGSGRVRHDVAGAEVRIDERDHLEMTVGGGAARVVLDAGSGSITVSGR